MTSFQFIDLKTQYLRAKDQIDARIQKVLAHGQFIMGPEIEELEARLSLFTGARHVVTCSNGTDALVMVMRAWGIGPGDAVFMPSFTFTATAEAALQIGAAPVFVDVDPSTFNIDCDDLESKIKKVQKDGGLTPRVVIAVDLFGLPADYQRLNAICVESNLQLLADAAQSMGAMQNNCRVGVLAPATTTSFFPAKPLGCYGDGGAVFCDDPTTASLLRSIRQHGKGEAKYDILRIGMNARLDTLQAAVLLAKMDFFEWELEQRERVARRYDQMLAPHAVAPQRVTGSSSAWAQYTIRVSHRGEIVDALNQQGIPSAIYYPRPMHLQPAYAPHSHGPGSLPISEKLATEVLSLPMHPYLEDADVDRIAGIVEQAIRMQRP